MKQIYLLSLSLAISSVFSQNPGDIIITEIMQNPAAVSDTNGEYFELYNTTTSDIDINEWIIKDLGSNSHVINNGGPLLVPANGYTILAKNSDAMANGGLTADYAYGSGMTLGNSDDEIILETPAAVIIDQVNYDGGTSFPNPTGASMNLDPTSYTMLDNDDGANWCAATFTYGDGDFGSPGSNNETCPKLGLNDNKFASLEMYPNPNSTGYVHINTSVNTDTSITVFDALGKQMLSRKLNDQRLDVSSLKAGIYVIRIRQNTNTITKKLVIK